MAAAIIPLIATATPLLVPLIQQLVLHVEALFGPKTGPAKLATVTQAVGDVANSLSTAGTLPGVLDPAAIASMVEVVVQALKGQGALTPTTATQAVQGASKAAAPITGQSVNVTGTLKWSAG